MDAAKMKEILARLEIGADAQQYILDHFKTTPERPVISSATVVASNQLLKTVVNTTEAKILAETTLFRSRRVNETLAETLEETRKALPTETVQFNDLNETIQEALKAKRSLD